VFTGKLSEAEFQPASPEEAADTVKVMGGEDWMLWIKALEQAGLLARGAITIAYSYIGPPRTWPIYRDGTIGAAKADLERTAEAMRVQYGNRGLTAYVSVNKALVTRSSSVIPVIPLYVSILYKVMKERGSHEDCIAQASRLFRERLYTGGSIPLDAGMRIRIDDFEMDEAVQSEVESRMGRITETTVPELADLAGFRDDFLRIHGFAVEGVDYLADCPVKGISIANFDLAAPVGGVGEESRT
jgi:enoyl-[acyl-carrier protein] reductase/trans-2-enoyl-CoA reductase (NAD+)